MNTSWFNGVILPLIFLANGLALYFGVNQGLQLHTDLNAMLPSSTQPSALRTAQEKVDQLINNRVVLLVGAGNLGDLDDAVDLVETAIEQSSIIAPAVDEERVYSRLLPLLEKHQFQLLREQDRKQFDAKSLNRLLAEERQRQYQMVTGPIAYERDLLGGLNRYILARADSEPAEFKAVWQGREYYFQGIFSRTINDSLDLEQQQALNHWLSSLRRQLQSIPNTELVTSGVVFFATHAAATAKSEINIIATISIFFILTLCWLAFRSLRPLLLALSSVGMGIVTSLLLCHWIFGGLHLLTLVFGAALIGVAVDFTIHFAFHHSDNGDGLSRRLITPPMLLSLGSSAIGYGAMLFTGLSGLMEIAVFSILGLAVACLAVLGLGQKILRQTQNGLQPGNYAVVQYLAKNLFRMRRGLPYFALSALAVFVAGHYLKLIPVRDDPRLLYSVSEKDLQQTTFLNRHLPHADPSRYLAVVAENEAELAGYLDQLSPLLEQWKNQGLISEIQWLRDWLPSPAKQQQNYQSYRNLLSLDSRAEITAVGVRPAVAEEFIKQLEISKDHQLLAADLMSALGDNSKLLWQSTPAGQVAFVRIKGLKDALAIKNYAAQHSNIYWVDRVSDIQKSLAQLRERALLFLGLSYTLIFILLWSRFPAHKAWQVISVPLLASLLTSVIIILAQIPFTLFHVLAFYLVLGLGIDYSVFMAAMQGEINKTRSSVLISAATSILAFGLLVWSSTPFVQQFGMVVLCGCLWNALLAQSLAEPKP